MAPAGNVILFGCFNAHFSDDFVEAAADGPIRFTGLALHFLDVSAIAHEGFEEFQALRRKAEEGRKLELADHTRTTRGAGELGNRQRR